MLIWNLWRRNPHLYRFTIQVAPYPFTTINPHLGVIDFDDHWRMRMADVPGIVAGAHMNVGLGLDFLRHVERCDVLVYVVDLRSATKETWEHMYIWMILSSFSSPFFSFFSFSVLSFFLSFPFFSLSFCLSLCPHSDDIGSPPPSEALRTMQAELEAYQPGMTQRSTIVVANKVMHV